MTGSTDPLVWLVDAASVDEASLAYHVGALGPSERARYARFARAERRRQFVIGRALLRRLLGRLLTIDPSVIVLDERAGQAPELLFPKGMISGFSISHSGRWVACAASMHTRLGLDIERIDPTRDVLALASQALGPDELAQLHGCEPAELHVSFYRLWCGHEARFKLGMDSVDEHPLDAPGLVGTLACAHFLSEAPRMIEVRLDGC